MILLSAFFSGSEIAFISANKLGIEIQRNKGTKSGKILAGFYEKPRQFVSTMLVGNNIALVILTILFTQLVEPILNPYVPQDSLLSLLIITIILTSIVLVFGEYLPKTIFSFFSNGILIGSAEILNLYVKLLWVPTRVMTVLSNLILKYVLRSPEKVSEIPLTRLDLEHFIQSNVINSEDIDKEILTNALNLDQLKVRDCMVPRNEIIYVDKSDSIAEIIDTFKIHKVSRVIVTDGDLENVLGYLHHLQLLNNPKKIDKLVMNIDFVPDAMSIRALLNQFIRTRTSMACVVDEFGGLSGLITLEDILEEIFGEIEDEHDDEEFTEKTISENEFIFSGRLEIDYLNEKYPQLNLPKGEYHTLSGLIVMNEEDIPEEGLEIRIGNNILTVEAVSDTKIELVRIRQLPTQIQHSES